jgi:DNA-binding SARP family transcriptional activator
MVTITLLGEQSVVDPETGRTLTRSARSMALLGVLVAHTGAPQSRSAIAGAFWPESGESQAMTNLRRELHQLRRWIGDDSLEVTGSHLCWHEQGRHVVDLATFLVERQLALDSDIADVVVEHGLRALEAYTGELLPGMDGDWLDQLRAQLRSTCLQLCDAVTVAARELGRGDVAIRAVRRRVALEPFDELAHRRLMELLVESGDRAGAVRVYHHLSELLERELGVTPDRRTSAVLERITGPEAEPAVEEVVSTTTRPVRVGRLVGRSAELDALLSAWSRARAGQPTFIVVTGPAGVGKTRLVDELAEQVAAERGVVAVSQCFESTGRLPLAPVASWLRSTPMAAARGTLDPVWQRETARLVPSGSADTPITAPENETWQLNRFLEGLARALAAPDRPTLLVLDNLQWCDADTLQVLTTLETVAPGAPVLVAVTARPDALEPGTRPSEWVADLRRVGRLTQVRLAPFDVADTAELARQLHGESPDRGDLALLHEATGGFPLFIVEALRSRQRSTPGPGPEGWSDILTGRFDQVSPRARATAELAAALRRDFTLPVLTAASDLPADAVVRAVDELWRQRLLRPSGDGYDFSHDLVRDAAYALVSPAQRWLLHRRLAEVLEALPESERDAVAPQIAEQHALASNRQQAVHWYLRAADAIGGGALHESLTLTELALDQVLALPENQLRDELELDCLTRKTGTLISLFGYAHADVEPTSRRIADLAERLGRPEAGLSAGVVLHGYWFVRGRMNEALAVATLTYERAQAGGNESDIAMATLSYAGANLHCGRVKVSVDAFEWAGRVQTSGLVSNFHIYTEVFLPAWWSHAAWARGDAEEAAALSQQALDRSVALDHVPSRVVALAYGVITAQLLQDRAECDRRSAELLRLCSRHDMGYYEQFGHIVAGWSRGLRPQVEGALARLRAGESFGRMPYWLMLLAELSVDQHEVAGLLDEAIRLAETGHEHLWLPELWRRRAALADADEARALLVRARDLATEQGSLAFRERAVRDLASPPSPNGSRTVGELRSANQDPTQ